MEQDTGARSSNIFYQRDKAYHTGIVTEVTASKVKTIEGNTSGASGVVENGGGVCTKSYDKTYSRILGYGLRIGAL